MQLLEREGPLITLSTKKKTKKQTIAEMNTFIIAIVRNRLDLQVGQDRLLACIGPAILHHLPGYSLGRILGPVYCQVVQVSLQP